jgi:large subunit ribosomal protein L29
MSLPNYRDLASLVTENDVEQELFRLQKSIFELKMAKASRKTFQPHLFKHTKRRIAQLLYKKSLLGN